MKYVIIGNSIAAVGTIEGIRKNDLDSEITVISKENHFVYSRPLISYMLLGKVAPDKVYYRDPDFYEKNKVNVLYSTSATKINRAEKTVELDSGKSVSFDKLMIAAGSKPFVPPIKGFETVENKHNFMSLDDANQLEKSITKDSRVLIIGAGLIGLKCAEGIANRVKSVTVVDLSNKILSSILDDTGSAIMTEYLKSKGISFILSKTVTEFCGNRGYISRENDEYVDFDVLVMAVGVKPNTEIARACGLEVDRGILVNEKMQTSDQSIYAAGDCAQVFDITIDEQSMLPLLPHAYTGGECAGINMTDNECACTGFIPMNAIGFFGLHIITAGRYIGDAKTVLNDKNEYKVLFSKDNLLKGYIIIGNVINAGIYTGLIRNKTPLDSIDYELICEKPTLMAFTKSDREKMLSE